MGEKELRRILMTADAVGGVFTYALRLGALLTQRGIEVHLATMGPRPSDLQRRAVADVGIVLYESDFRLEWMDAPWRDVEAASEWLLGLEQVIEPDIVHLNGYCHADLGWGAPVVVVAHSCVLSWWRAVHGATAPPEWDEYRRRVRKGLEGAHLVMAPTRAMLRCLEREYGALPRTAVVHHGMPAQDRPSVTDRSDIILSAGRLWDEAKNVAALEAVAERLPFPVVLAGADRLDGSSAKRLNGVRYLGALSPESLREWMSRAAIYALPARYEPFGLSVLEAAHAGCALVLGDIESLRELWDDAAIFVPPNDRNALADALTRVCRDPSLRKRLAERATERARTFRSSEMIEAYLRQYVGLLREHDGASAEKTHAVVS